MLQHLNARTMHTLSLLQAGTCSVPLQGASFFPRSFGGRAIGFFASSIQQSSSVLHGIAASGAAGFVSTAGGAADAATEAEAEGEEEDVDGGADALASGEEIGVDAVGAAGGGGGSVLHAAKRTMPPAIEKRRIRIARRIRHRRFRL
jgi:hypothetical protein